MKKNYFSVLFFFFWVVGYAQFNNYLNFDGIDDGVYLSSINFFPDNNDFRTVEVRVRTTQNNSGSVIFTYGTPNATNKRFALYQVNGKLKFIGGGNDLETNAVISDGVWHHIAATYDGVDLKLYVDGVLVGTKTTSFATDTTEGNIGTKNAITNNIENFEGDIDELRVWTYFKTEAEIQASKDTEITFPQSNLNVYAKFNQGVAFGNNFTEQNVNFEVGPLQGIMLNFSLMGNTSNWANDTTLSNDELFTRSKKLVVFPNPSTKFIKVAGLKEATQYYLFSILGEEVKSGVLRINETITVSELTKGMYVLKLNDKSIKFLKD